MLYPSCWIHATDVCYKENHLFDIIYLRCSNEWCRWFLTAVIKLSVCNAWWGKWWPGWKNHLTSYTSVLVCVRVLFHFAGNSALYNKNNNSLLDCDYWLLCIMPGYLFWKDTIHLVICIWVGGAKMKKMLDIYCIFFCCPTNVLRILFDQSIEPKELRH